MLTVAILGAGIGAQHLEGYQALPERYRVAIICDRNTERAAALAAKAPGCRAIADLDEALTDPSVDIVDVCLPPHLHGPVVLRALAAGKHVVCEKPIAGSVLEADRIAAAVVQHRQLFVPIFQYRYGREFYRLSALQERGLTGRPLVATLETHWDRGADYYSVDWRGRWASESGGVVLGHAIHIHDLITRYFGPVTALSAMLDTRVNPIETEDCAAVAMTTRSGGLVTSSVTLGSVGNMSRLRLAFENLTAESGRNPYAPGDAPWSFVARGEQNQAALDTVLAEIDAEVEGRPTGFAGQFDALARRLAGEPTDMVSVEDAVRSIESVAAIYQSARTGAQVTLPLDRSLPVCANWVPEDFRPDDQDAQSS